MTEEYSSRLKNFFCKIWVKIYTKIRTECQLPPPQPRSGPGPSSGECACARTPIRSSNVRQCPALSTGVRSTQSAAIRSGVGIDRCSVNNTAKIQCF